MALPLSLSLLLALAAAVLAQQRMQAPVIGVLTQNSLTHNPGKSYLAASYVKYLESAGARVVPIHYEADKANLTATFSMINGLLIPGGAQNLVDPTNPFMVAARTLYDLAVESNRQGEVFPIWGTCMGFQTVSILAANSPNVLSTGFDSENLPLPLTLTAAANTSRLFSAAPPGLLDALATLPITMNSHHDGVTPADFAASSDLSSTFTILSTNVDRSGRAFVSTMEAKQLPFYATQWHPEKNAFEWTADENIPHSAIAVAACQFTAKFFVDQARQSTHVYPSDQLLSDVIWNYQPIYTLIEGSDFVQVYSWN